MIGIGTWSAKINTFFFKAEATVDIMDQNGEYAFAFHLPEQFSNVSVRYFDVREEGDTLCGKGEVSLLPGKIFEGKLTFHGDKLTGSIVLPFLDNKTVELQDGHRVK